MELGALYQDVILDHNRSPRNFGPLSDPSASAEGRNPMCGDEVTVWLRVEGDVISDVSFVGTGCAISKASASMMTQAIKGKTRAEAEAIFAQFHEMLTVGDVGGQADAQGDQSLGRLRAFQGVRRFPMRVKCASLAWHAMKKALSDA